MTRPFAFSIFIFTIRGPTVGEILVGATRKEAGSTKGSLHLRDSFGVRRMIIFIKPFFISSVTCFHTISPHISNHPSCG
jgi:hypothetical protein